MPLLLLLGGTTSSTVCLVGLEYVINRSVVDGFGCEVIFSCFRRAESERVTKSVGSVLTTSAKLKYKTFSCVCSFSRSAYEDAP